MKHQNTLISFLLLGSLVFGLGCSSDKPIEQPDDNPKLAESSKGVIAAAHPAATKVGRDILNAGGNAVDAAVAAGFALSVAEPDMSGLGGRLQAIVHTPNGAIRGVDASTEGPLHYDRATAEDAPYGYPIIGVPGVVAGLLKLHADHGKLPLADIIQPAIDLARNGVEILPGEAYRHSLVKKALLEFEGSKKYYIKNDSMTYETGDILVQEDLAKTLEKIRDGGHDAFYKGDIAEKIVADMEANGGYVDLESMAAYQAKESEIVSANYRGFDIYGLWLPSFGAITMESLNILSNLPIDSYTKEQWGSAVYQATRLAYNDRLAQLEHGADYFLTKDRADSLANHVNVNEPDTVFVGQVNEEYPELKNLISHGHTTHLSAADSEGYMIALTQSLGPIFGSKVATPGLGFMYASTLGSYLGPFSPGPGDRAVSHISPTIVLKEGKPFMALGAAGGDKIVTAVVQVISRVIDQGMSLEDALAAGRVHPNREGGMDLELHDGISWSDEDFAFLADQGLLIRPEERTSRFGRVHAVLHNFENKTWKAAADPDWEGTALGIN